MARTAMAERAKELLEKCESVSLASITQAGYPRICEMEVARSDGIGSFYFATLKESSKVKHFRQNNKGSVGLCVGNDSVSLMGTVEIIEDEAQKQALLPAEYTARLRKKGSTRYCVLHFEAVEGKAFVDGKFETLTEENLR